MLARRLKLPPAVVKDMDIPPFRPKVEPAQIKIMIEMLAAQHALTHDDLSPDSMVWH